MCVCVWPINIISIPILIKFYLSNPIYIQESCLSLYLYICLSSLSTTPAKKNKVSCYQEFNFDSTVPRVWDPHGSRSKILLAGQLVNFDTHIPICLELILVLEKVGSYAAAFLHPNYHGICGDIRPLHRFWLIPQPSPGNLLGCLECPSTRPSSHRCPASPAVSPMPSAKWWLAVRSSLRVATGRDSLPSWMTIGHHGPLVDHQHPARLPLHR